MAIERSSTELDRYAPRRNLDRQFKKSSPDPQDHLATKAAYTTAPLVRAEPDAAKNAGLSAHFRNSHLVLRMAELQLLTGISRSGLYERMNPNSQSFDPTFPRKRVLGPRAVGWLLGEVTAWITSLAIG